MHASACAEQISFASIRDVSRCVVFAGGLDARLLLALRRMLAGLGFQALVHAAPEAALAACDRASVMLAGGHDAGLGLIWHLRRQFGPRKGPRCIVLLEEARLETVLSALAAGADECLAWPFSAQQLAQRLRQLAV